MIKRGLLSLGLGLAFATGAQAAEQVDLDMVGKIRQEAFHRSQVMDTFSHLTETIGPRLTNSPAMAQANAWTRQKFTEWGLADVHDEAFEDFGRGWEFDSASVEMLEPRVTQLYALPKAWTPGTHGTVEGEVVKVDIKKLVDLEKYKGQLRGKILLLGDARDYKRGTEADSHRHDATSLEDLQQFAIPKDTSKERAKRLKEFGERQELVRATNTFFVEEGALAAISISGWDNGIIRVGGGGSRKAGEPVGIPELAMIAEHYNQLARALERKQPVKLRVNVDARFTDEADQPGNNTLAEIRGSNLLAVAAPQSYLQSRLSGAVFLVPQ